MKCSLLLRFAPLSVLVSCGTGAADLDALGLVQRAVGVSPAMSNSTRSMEATTRMSFLMNALEELMAPVGVGKASNEYSRFRQAVYCGGNIVAPASDIIFGIIDSIAGVKANCPEKGNPECLPDVSNFVGGIVALTATAMDLPLNCLKAPKDCSDSKSWKRLHQASVVMNLGGVGATTVATSALLKHLCINKNTDDIAATSELNIAPVVFLLLTAAASTGDVLESFDFGKDWVADNLSRRPQGSQPPKRTPFSFCRAVAGLLNSVAGSVQKGLAIKMHDKQDLENDDGWKSACATVVPSLIQTALGLIENTCALIACHNEEDRADVINDGSQNGP